MSPFSDSYVGQQEEEEIPRTALGGLEEIFISRYLAFSSHIHSLDLQPRRAPEEEEKKDFAVLIGTCLGGGQEFLSGFCVCFCVCVC